MRTLLAVVLVLASAGFSEAQSRSLAFGYPGGALAVADDEIVRAEVWTPDTTTPETGDGEWVNAGLVVHPDDPDTFLYTLTDGGPLLRHVRFVNMQGIPGPWEGISTPERPTNLRIIATPVTP